ncbi:MAG: hypothetical protein KDB00_17250 [Planctomycetales bacterium]|nr:hypothetical protein [Planctomycetales bacterium]
MNFAPQGWSIHTIGFGVIAAGIETAHLIATRHPERVVLAGIAGLFASSPNPSVKVGDAIWFDSIAIDGIGIGQGDAFIDASQLGWKWNSHDTGDGRIRCHPPGPSSPAMLLTVCSGSADPADAQRRSLRFPEAIGEDMEAFAVAYACQSAGIPISVVRGFSNIAGRRDKTEWRIDQALAGVANQLQTIIDGHFE